MHTFGFACCALPPALDPPYTNTGGCSSGCLKPKGFQDSSLLFNLRLEFTREALLLAVGEWEAPLSDFGSRSVIRCSAQISYENELVSAAQKDIVFMWLAHRETYVVHVTL